MRAALASSSYNRPAIHRYGMKSDCYKGTVHLRHITMPSWSAVTNTALTCLCAANNCKMAFLPSYHTVCPSMYDNKQSAQSCTCFSLICFSRSLSLSSIFSPWLLAVVTTESDAMPGRIPDPSVTAGSLPSLGPLAGISATTLTDELRFGDFQEFGTMLSPLHFLGSLGKRPPVIKTEVQETRSSW